MARIFHLWLRRPGRRQQRDPGPGAVGSLRRGCLRHRQGRTRGLPHGPGRNRLRSRPGQPDPGGAGRRQRHHGPRRNDRLPGGRGSCRAGFPAGNGSAGATSSAAVTGPRRVYPLCGLLAVGDVADVHLAAESAYLLKVSRFREAIAFWTTSGRPSPTADRRGRHHLPQDTCRRWSSRSRPGTGSRSGSTCSCTSPGFYTLEQVHEQHPALDGRHLAWIFKRLLTVLGFCHRQGDRARSGPALSRPDPRRQPRLAARRLGPERRRRASRSQAIRRATGTGIRREVLKQATRVAGDRPVPGGAVPDLPGRRRSGA